MRSKVSREYQNDDHINPQEQVVLEWKNIEFHVPVKKPANWAEKPRKRDLLIEDRQPKINEATGIPEPTIRQNNQGFFKQVLQNTSGFVKPREMVAIMGPSGSGKTSLLNVLSQRSALSNGSFIKGDVLIN